MAFPILFVEFVEYSIVAFSRFTLVKFVADIDIIKCSAKVAVLYNYCIDFLECFLTIDPQVLF